MKHFSFKNLNSRLIICFIVILVVFVIHSCKKDNAAKQQTAINNIAVSQAKAWYENAYPVTTNTATDKIVTDGVNTATNGTFDLSQIIKPDWQHPATYARLGSNVIEMPVDPGANFGSDIKNISAGKKYNKTTFLLLNNGKGYQAYIMMIMADSAYVKNDFSKLAHNSYRKHDADFSGLVLYFTPKGRYVGGYRYRNGQLVTPASAGGSSGGQTVQNVNTAASKPVTDVVEPPVCTDWYADFYIDGVFWFSEYLGQTCTSGGGGSGSSGGAGSPGGGSPPPPQCPASGSGSSDASVGHLTIYVTAPPGDGGVPPPSDPCTTTVIQQPDSTKIPCAGLDHLDSLAQNSVIANANQAVYNEIGTGHEFATDINLTTFPPVGNGSYISTPLTTDFNQTSVTSNFTWNSTNGYTIDISHDHPGGDGPSPADIFRLYVNSNNADLDNAGAAALTYYEKNATMTTVTKSTTYNITGANYTRLGQLYQTYKADTAAFNSNYRQLTSDDQGAWDQALLTIFGNSINLYESYFNKPTFTLFQNVNGRLTTVNCP